MTCPRRKGIVQNILSASPRMLTAGTQLVPRLAVHLPREARRRWPVFLSCVCLCGLVLFYHVQAPERREAAVWKARKMESTYTFKHVDSASRADSSRRRELSNPVLIDEAISQKRSLLATSTTAAPSNGTAEVTLQPDPVRWPWEEFPGCSKYGIRFAQKRSLPVTALTSYPGSGNTWTRYLLEMATGVFTGSIYYDMGLYTIGYWGELTSPEDGTTVAQKVHEYGADDVERFNRTGIVIVRNPYRAILSFHNYLFGGHKGMAPSSHYLKKSWSKFVMKQVFEWSQHVQTWTDPKNRVLVVHYESLKADALHEVRRMMHFLHWPIDELRLQCLQADLNGNFQRHQQHRPRQLEPFPPSLREGLDLAINTIDNLLKSRGHPRLPLKLYEFYNGSTLRTEILEDCEPGEELKACFYRIDKVNFKHHIKSFFELVRNHVKISVLGKLLDGAADAVSEGIAASRDRNGTLTRIPALKSEALTKEEEDLVERMLEKANKTSAGSHPLSDGKEDRFYHKMSRLLKDPQSLGLDDPEKVGRKV